MTKEPFPRCHAAGVLRDTRGTHDVVSSAALYGLLGDVAYQRAIKMLDYEGINGVGGWTPESVELFLAVRDWKAKLPLTRGKT